MNSCESTTKRLLHRASHFFIFSFNNHKSANNQVQRYKQLKNPVGQNQATIKHNSEWARWLWICLYSIHPKLNSEKILWSRTGQIVQHLPFHSCGSTNQKHCLELFSKQPQGLLRFQYKYSKTVRFSSKCRYNMIFVYKMRFIKHTNLSISDCPLLTNSLMPEIRYLKKLTFNLEKFIIG